MAYQKGSKEFCCIECNYQTSKTSSWKKHISTRKHKLITNKSAKVAHICKKCGRSYSHASGLSRHKKKCSKP